MLRLDSITKVAFVTCLLWLAWPGRGDEIFVPPGTIQAAIDLADDGDVIIVTAADMYESDIDFKGKRIVVRSADPNHPESYRIHAAWQDGHRVFHFHSGETPASVLTGFTLLGGRGDHWRRCPL